MFSRFNRIKNIKKLFIRNKTMMSAGEGITETLLSRDIKNVFGITGSAFLNASDCFETAGIKLTHFQHEQNAIFACDGFSRVSRKVSATLNQAGPGSSNLLTGLATSYWNHSPVVAITPDTDSSSVGKGGFQELNGLDRVFQDQVKYLGNVKSSNRTLEILGKGLDRALSLQGPTQVNIPRDYFNNYEEFQIPKKILPNPNPSNPIDIQNACNMIEKSKKPIILAGAGINWSEGAYNTLIKFSDKFNIPVATSYMHNDVFPYNNKLSLGPLGYFGSKAAMKVMSDSDLVIAIGTRCGPFSLTKQYNIDYWSDDRNLIQVDIDKNRLGLSCEPNIPICSDANLFMKQVLHNLDNINLKFDTYDTVKKEKNIWNDELHEMTYNQKPNKSGYLMPKRALKEISDFIYQLSYPIVTTDIGNCSSQANTFMKFSNDKSYLCAGLFGSCGYSVPAAMGAKIAMPTRDVFSITGDGAFAMQSLGELLTLNREKIPITMIVMRNDYWFAEALNQRLYFGERYNGTQLHDTPSFTNIAKSMGIEGIEVRYANDINKSLKKAVENQRKGLSTLVEIYIEDETTPIFRSDAMSLPYRFLPKYKHISVAKKPPI
jgi:sulfoacetaldehyde acetyltransferase